MESTDSDPIQKVLNLIQEQNADIDTLIKMLKKKVDVNMEEEVKTKEQKKK